MTQVDSLQNLAYLLDTQQSRRSNSSQDTSLNELVDEIFSSSSQKSDRHNHHHRTEEEPQGLEQLLPLIIQLLQSVIQLVGRTRPLPGPYPQPGPQPMPYPQPGPYPQPMPQPYPSMPYGGGMGGYPMQGMGGYPTQGMGGYPMQGMGGYPTQGMGGYPMQGMGGYNPYQGYGGSLGNQGFGGLQGLLQGLLGNQGYGGYQDYPDQDSSGIDLLKKLFEKFFNTDNTETHRHRCDKEKEADRYLFAKEDGSGIDFDKSLANASDKLKAYDTDNDGKVSLEEIDEGEEKLRITDTRQIDGEESTETVTGLTTDVNHDGFISPVEYLALQNSMDADASGILSKKEIKEANKTDPNVRYFDIYKIVDEFGENDPSLNGEDSDKETIEALSNDFAKYDTDKNGFISKDELEAIEDLDVSEIIESEHELIFANIDRGIDAWFGLSTNDLNVIKDKLTEEGITLDQLGNELRTKAAKANGVENTEEAFYDYVNNMRKRLEHRIMPYQYEDIAS